MKLDGIKQEQRMSVIETVMVTMTQQEADILLHLLQEEVRKQSVQSMQWRAYNQLRNDFAEIIRQLE